MKVWIDKDGGTHYHKDGCKMIQPMNAGKLPPIKFHYESIEHQLRKIPAPYRKMFGTYKSIIVDHERYEPCPMCFGHGGRNE